MSQKIFPFLACAFIYMTLYACTCVFASSLFTRTLLVLKCLHLLAYA